MTTEEWAAWIDRNPVEAARVLWLAEQNGAIRLHHDHIWVGTTAIGGLR